MSRLSKRSKRIALIAILILVWLNRATISSYLLAVEKFFWYEIVMRFQPCGSMSVFFKLSNCLGQEPHTSLNGVIKISNKGSLIATGTVDGRVHLWDISETLPDLMATVVVKEVEQGRAFHEFSHYFLPKEADSDERTYPPHAIDSIAFSHDDRILAVAMTGKPVTLYNIEDDEYGKAYRTSLDMYNSLRQLEYSKDGSTLAGYSQDHETIHLFDAESLELLASIDGLGYGLAPDNQTLFVLNLDGKLEKWRYQDSIELLQTSSEQRQIRLKPQKVQIEFTSNNSELVVMHSPAATQIVGGKQSANSLYTYDPTMGIDGSNAVHLSTWKSDSLEQIASWSHEIHTTFREPKFVLNNDEVLLLTTQFATVALSIDLTTSQPQSAFVKKPYGRFYLERYSLDGQSKSETDAYFASYKTVDFLGIALSADKSHVYGATTVIWPYHEDEYGYFQVWNVE